MVSMTFSVAFDLDDTLYPESEFVLSGFRAVADHLSERCDHGRDEIFNKLESDFHQGVRGNNFDRILEYVNLEADVETLVEIYSTHEPDIELVVDARECLKKLTDRQVAIVTDGDAVKQRNKIRALDLGDVVDKIYISDEFGPEGGKPSTRMFDAFLSETETSPEAATYIADNPAKDFIAPNEIGMRSVWVNRSWGEYMNEEPTTERQTPTHRIEDLRDVPELLEKWENEL
ncbi:HAD family hydrolase [Halosimplex pelagicum]|uniref:HAD family hydrolase n=1 Tax=Halosimplex pelagicum TaxID=869886 RepID=A0A7D5P8A9_9EURY|nr:HAD family hydrolase [Halosimplex pelagicum]QLH81204.1 HAD family hydrolase [Halosimplex pelagicum]